MVISWLLLVEPMACRKRVERRKRKRNRRSKKEKGRLKTGDCEEKFSKVEISLCGWLMWLTALAAKGQRWAARVARARYEWSDTDRLEPEFRNWQKNWWCLKRWWASPNAEGLQRILTNRIHSTHSDEILESVPLIEEKVTLHTEEILAPLSHVHSRRVWWDGTGLQNTMWLMLFYGTVQQREECMYSMYEKAKSVSMAAGQRFGNTWPGWGARSCRRWTFVYSARVLVKFSGS